MLLLILLIPNPGQAADGRFARIMPGQTLSFSAWCFDDLAAARIKSSLEFAIKNCQLRIDRELDKQKAEFNLQLENLQVRLSSVKSSCDDIIKIKDKEIKDLTEAALKRPNDNSYLWASGGIAVGILTTLAVVYSVSSITK